MDKKTKYRSVELARLLEKTRKECPECKRTKPLAEAVEAPIQKEIRKSNGIAYVSKQWKEEQTHSKVKRVVYFEEEGLDNLNTVPVNGEEVVRVEYRGTNYILRKTKEPIANAILNVYSKIRDRVEQIVGYVVTVTGLVYLISKVNEVMFTSNKHICSGNLKYCQAESLSSERKEQIAERAVEHIIELNKKNLLVQGMGTENLLYNEQEVRLGDLRGLRMSTKPATFLVELKVFLRELVRKGWVSSEGLTYLLALYMGAHPEMCASWYAEEYGKEAKEEIEILEVLERRVVKGSSN